jgi:MoaA/NifB/PqqE/SkfB family radical SAM enzyme
MTPADHPLYRKIGFNIDITDKCVLACPRCMRQAKPGLHKRGGDLTAENFRKVAKVFNRISWCGQMGDPIYHSDMHSLLDVAIDEQIDLSIATNGFGKKDKWWDISYEKVAQIKKHRWVFGVDGLPKDSHNYRVNQDGEAVFRQMIRGVNAGNNIIWQYIVFSYNEDNIEEAEKMAKDNGIQFMLVESSRWYTDDDPLKPTKYFIDRVVGKEIERMGEIVND